MTARVAAPHLWRRLGTRGGRLGGRWPRNKTTRQPRDGAASQSNKSIQKEQIMKRRFRPTVIAAVLVALVAFSAATARAQVLDQVPADALVVVRIKNIEAVSKKVADYSAAL